MANYTGRSTVSPIPTAQSLDVKEGERVEITFTNSTNMGHPMHLHGHDYQVVEIDSEKISGALRDTILIPPRSTIKIAFDADNPGLWAFHCHLLYSPRRPACSPCSEIRQRRSQPVAAG